MNNEPQVSVVLANWNGGRFLDEAIASVVNQTFANWELVAVDTGSEDASCAKLDKWAKTDKRIKPIFIPKRLVYPVAINRGIKEVQGKFIARIESDDVWLPSRLEKQVALLNEPGNQLVGICGSDAILIDADGRENGVKKFPRSHRECMQSIWFRNPFCHSSVLMRRAVFDGECGYDENYYLVEDLELWLRIGKRWEFRNLAEPLVQYRIWSDSNTSKRMWHLARLSHQVRGRAVREFGYRRSWLARMYSFATLGVALLPPRPVRAVFELALRVFDRSGETALPGVKMKPDTETKGVQATKRQ